MHDTFTPIGTTLIRYRDPMGAIDWLRMAFQFEPRFIAKRSDGTFAYAHLVLGEQQITVTTRDERSLGPPSRETQEPTLVVADLAAHFAHAKAAGAQIVRGIDAGEEGARGYVCRDVEGHTWAFTSARAQGLETFVAWARMRMPHIEKRAGVAAAAALTLVAFAYPAWRLHTMATAPPDAAMAEPADASSAPSSEIAADQALEHARFALAEEQAARLAAEASRRTALAKLAQERVARLEAEQDARRFESELTAARATRAAAESFVQDLHDDEMGWDTQIARASGDESPPPPNPAEIVPVSVTPPPSEATPDAAQPTPPPSEAAPEVGQPTPSPSEATPDVARPISAPSEAAPEVAQPTPPPSEATPDVAQPTLPQEPKDVLAEGQAALAKGDIAEARRLFRQLADEGVAEAALALGSTYDPVNAKRAGMTGVKVDRAQAKQWYRRAIELAQGAIERQHEP